MVWAFLRPRLPHFLRRKPRLPASAACRPAGNPASAEGRRKNLEDVLFGKAAILRALIVFNLMFAVQTVLDAAYLWGGVALPDGMTYASYAHRGAYPLIVTALIAAGFVLAALQAGQRHLGRCADPAAGLSLGRAEHRAGGLVDPAGSTSMSASMR